MAGIRFVMEGPNADLSQKKKRARLITACDACRTKKIKCVQPNLNMECDACRRSQTACLFGDRDRYHTERGISTVPSGAGSMSIGMGAGGPYNGFFGYYDDPIPGYQFVHEQNAMFPGSVSGSEADPSVPYAASTQASQNGGSVKCATHLFDPEDAQRPRGDLMAHLADTFFSHCWIQFPFLDRCSTMARLSSSCSNNGGNGEGLSNLLQNAMAALAARYSSHPDISSSPSPNCQSRPPHLNGEPYLHMAKLIATYTPPAASLNLETLHALLLIAWAEYGNSTPQGMACYTQLVVSVALELGLDRPRTSQLPENPETREMLRLTWFTVRRLDLTASWTLGCPTSLDHSLFEDGNNGAGEMTPLSLKALDGASRTTLLFACLGEIFAIHDAISAIMNDSSAAVETHGAGEAISALQARLQSFHATLPSELRFTASNYASHHSASQASALTLLHTMFHGTNAIAHWPGLFKSFPPSSPNSNGQMQTQTPIPENVEAAYASSLAIVDILLTAKQVDHLSAVTDPFLEVPLAVATRVLMTAPAALSAKSGNNAQSEFFKDATVGYAECMQCLGELARYWVSTHIVPAPSPSPQAQMMGMGMSMGMGLSQEEMMLLQMQQQQQQQMNMPMDVPTFTGEPTPIATYTSSVSSLSSSSDGSLDLSSSWESLMSPPALTSSPSSIPSGSPFSSSPTTPLMPVDGQSDGMMLVHSSSSQGNGGENPYDLTIPLASPAVQDANMQMQMQQMMGMQMMGLNMGGMHLNSVGMNGMNMGNGGVDMNMNMMGLQIPGFGLGAEDGSKTATSSPQPVSASASTSTSVSSSSSSNPSTPLTPHHHHQHQHQHQYQHGRKQSLPSQDHTLEDMLNLDVASSPNMHGLGLGLGLSVNTSFDSWDSGLGAPTDATSMEKLVALQSQQSQSQSHHQQSQQQQQGPSNDELEQMLAMAGGAAPMMQLSNSIGSMGMNGMDQDLFAQLQDQSLHSALYMPQGW